MSELSVEERLAQLESDLSFVVRFLSLHEKGHATPADYGRLREIKDRHA